MSIVTIANNEYIAKNIRERRQGLNLSIEAASRIANISTKTWCRYEAGEPIRTDKANGVAKALMYPSFEAFLDFIDDIPMEETVPESTPASFIRNQKNNYYWSKYLETTCGDLETALLTKGINILLSTIEPILLDLREMPIGTHIGQFPNILSQWLPMQFITRYDYEFIYLLKYKTNYIMERLESGRAFYCRSVMDEIVVYASYLLAKSQLKFKHTDQKLFFVKTDEPATIEEVLFEDDFISCYLYRDLLMNNSYYLEEDHPYHFNNWNKRQFFTNIPESPSGIELLEETRKIDTKEKCSSGENGEVCTINLDFDEIRSSFKKMEEIIDLKAKDAKNN